MLGFVAAVWIRPSLALEVDLNGQKADPHSLLVDAGWTLGSLKDSDEVRYECGRLYEMYEEFV